MINIINYHDFGERAKYWTWHYGLVVKLCCFEKKQHIFITMSVRRRQNLRRERLKNLRHGSTIEELSLEVEDIDVQVQSYCFFDFLQVIIDVQVQSYCFFLSFTKCLWKFRYIFVFSQQVFSFLFAESLCVLLLKYDSPKTHIAFSLTQLFCIANLK